MKGANLCLANLEGKICHCLCHEVALQTVPVVHVFADKDIHLRREREDGRH